MPAYWTGISQPANGTSLRAGRDVAVVERGAAQGGFGGGATRAPGYNATQRPPE